MIKSNQVDAIRQFAGNAFIDDRGMLSFVNDFDFSKIKRFYQVENFSLNTIRAFHGHMKEGKYVYVTSGSVLLCLVPLDKVIKPSKKNFAERFILSEKKPQIIFIPPQYANGFKSLENETKIIFFSTSSLEESKGDDYRYPYDYWGTKIWEVENR